MKIWTRLLFYDILLAHKWLCCAGMHILIMPYGNKKASDSHYERNLKSGDSGHNSELKKETREHSLVLLCFLVYNTYWRW